MMVMVRHACLCWVHSKCLAKYRESSEGSRRESGEFPKFMSITHSGLDEGSEVNACLHAHPNKRCVTFYWYDVKSIPSENESFKCGSQPNSHPSISHSLTDSPLGILFSCFIKRRKMYFVGSNVELITVVRKELMYST